MATTPQSLTPSATGTASVAKKMFVTMSASSTGTASLSTTTIPIQIWPSTLPNYVLSDGYRYQQKSMLLRTEMDRGPAKVRRRSTFEPTIHIVRWLMNATELSALETWFENNLDAGVAPFQMAHPITGTTKRFRFRGPYVVADKRAGNYEVSAQLEQLN